MWIASLFFYIKIPHGMQIWWWNVRTTTIIQSTKN